jgi:hypothetical protein
VNETDKGGQTGGGHWLQRPRSATGSVGWAGVVAGFASQGVWRQW